MKFKYVVVILFFSVEHLRTQTSISWYSFNAGFARGVPSQNNGLGLGSVVGQSFVDTLSGSGITIKSGFAANSNAAFRSVLSLVELNIPTGMPTVYSLSQNYPNPFNPSTNIRFAIRQRTKVKLMLYNLLGQQVATLVNEEFEVGEYSVPFFAQSLPSGIYIYRLTAGEFVQQRKMILLR